ncbi:MAG TPA: glycosyltransferase family 39 protein [Flavipsychrobacter sp.]|nr:glycosyltransferase family 39 protein [Flavipsychrobacter sp.]
MAKKISQPSTSNKKEAVSANTSKQKSVSIPNVAAIQNESEVWKKVLFFSLLGIFILMTIMSFSYGISGDEVDMNEYGKAVLKYFTTFGHDQTVLNMPKEYNRDGVMQYYGGLFDLICAIVNKFSPFNEYATRHVLNAWAGFLAIFFSVKICIRTFGRQAAVLCAWLMFLAPFFLGHAMNNPKDIPFATAYIAAIYCIILLFDHLPKPSIKYYVFAIISIGAAINVRVGGILLLPYMIVFALIIYIVKRVFQGEKIVLTSWVKPLVVVAVLGYLAGSVFWPYGQKNPISNPLTALSEMSNFKVNIAQLFEGEKVFSGDLPSNFLPKSFLITNSYVFLIGLGLMVLFLWGIRKKEYASIIYFIVFTGIFPVAYIIYQKANVYHAWRHVLFIFPSLAIASAGGWYLFSNYLAKRNVKFGMAIAGVLLLEPLYFIVSTFPNTITYYNAFAGGVQGAYGNYEMDYYYNSMKQDADWFEKNILPKYKPTDTIIVASNAAHLIRQYFKNDKNVQVEYVRFPERDEKPWDYSIFHIALIPDEEIRSGTWLPSTTVYKAEVRGCVLSAIAKRPSYDDLKGFDALEKNQADSAIQYFTSYLKKDPNNVDMLNIMANIFHQLHRDDIAQQYAEQVNKLLASGVE